MSPKSLFSRPIHVGVALAPNHMVAVVPGSPKVRTWTLAEGDDAGVSPELRDALGALHAALGEARSRGVLHIALLPHYARLRFVDVPGIDATDAQRVLARDPSRYVPVRPGTEPFEVEVEGNGWRQIAPFAVTIAPRAVVEAVHATAIASGWRTVKIVPAYSAWAASARVLLPRTTLARTLVLCDEERIAMLGVRDGRVVALRRFPASAADVARLAAESLPAKSGLTTETPATVAVIGEGAVADELRALLHLATQGERIGKRVGSRSDSPASLAARYARRAHGPLLLTENERASRQRRSRRNTRARFLAAALLLAGAGLVDFWGTSRERAGLAAERARIHDEVSRALATRDSLTGATDRLATLRATIESAPRWSRVVTSLASELPDDAFLTALHAAEDTLQLQGTATRAAPVFEAVRGDPSVRSVRPEGPIRQEVADDETTESFTLLASLRRAP